MSVSPITPLLSQHPILRTLASFLSTLDLYNLGRTNQAHFSYILSSRRAFKILSRESICDGRGLVDRQDFQGLYSLEKRSYVWGGTRKIWQDEPIEVRLYGTKCDTAGALPCRKCNVNICEECRYYPREPPHAHYPKRRPHLNSPWQNENTMCLCDSCDVKLESELRGKFLSELCDCDIYTRWICHKCVREEREFTHQYYVKYTSHEYDIRSDFDVEKLGKMMTDHQNEITFYCACGGIVPQEARPRCTWCKRMHLPEEDWFREYEEIGSKMPIFEEDPCLAPYIGNIYAECCDRPYPKLAYDGPIYKVPE